MRHLAPSPRPSDPPPWWLEMCLGCARYTALEVYELSCCCSCGACGHGDSRSLFAVAWICDHCDHVVESVGLFTNWPAALDARRRVLNRRELDGTPLWRRASDTSTTNVRDRCTTSGA